MNLLKTQQERLKIALKWEKKKGIVNPETSSIIDSIRKMEQDKKDPFKGAVPYEVCASHDKPREVYGLDQWKV